MRATTSALLLLGLIGAACLPPPLKDCTMFECSASSPGDTDETGDTDATSTPTDGDPGVQTVTGDEEPPNTSEVDTTSTSVSTTGEPAELPAILEVELDPNPITANGTIAVSVVVEHADGVRMQLDDGTQIDLDNRGGDEFSGGIPVYTGLLNGVHEAVLTPFQDPQLDGVPVVAPYTVQLPKPGDPIFWETGDLIGPGEVVAMATLPGGEVIELGNHAPMGEQRCYLRRRDKGGAWGPEDLVDVLPDIKCAAIDLQVDELGAMYVLLEREGGDGVRWWFAKISSWGLGAKNIGTGEKDQTATALALHPSGMAAVCGFAPATKVEEDGMAWVFRPGEPGETIALDYAIDYPTHSFSERIRDCQFTGDTLALAGEAFGFFEKSVMRERLLLTRVDIANKYVDWTVAPIAAQTTQSGAQALTIDDQGRSVLVGYVCDDDCEPEGEMRIYDDNGGLVWLASLGVFPTKELTGRDIAWDPAGFAVVATGGIKGKEAAFVVRGFAPFKYDPLWTFIHQDNQVLQFVNTLAIGRAGQVYGGGFGANGYPAVAYIAN